MPSLEVIGANIKEKQRGGHYVPPSLNRVKGEREHKNKLTSYESANEMLENDMYIGVIG